MAVVEVVTSLKAEEVPPHFLVAAQEADSSDAVEYANSVGVADHEYFQSDPRSVPKVLAPICFFVL